jgi:hypothetical protein
MMKTLNLTGTLLISSLLGAVALPGCGGSVETADADEESGEIDYSMHCNESRGQLHTYQMMVDGQARIDQATLDTWALIKLAEERKAPAEVTGHIEGWNQARQVQRDARRAMPPVFAEGRVIEPDTSDIDRQMVLSIQPHHAALKQWVKKECGEI